MALSTGCAHGLISKVIHLYLISSHFFFTLKTLNASLRSIYTMCAKVWFQSSAVFELFDWTKGRKISFTAGKV